MDKNVFFTWDGIGDNLILLGAAYNYFLHSGEKPLIATDLPFIKYSDFATHITGLSFRSLNENYNSIMSSLKKRGLNPIFITASGYQYLAPSYKSNVTTWIPKHMITRYCERMGISGDIHIEIPLNIPDDPSIKLPKDYVCVMCGGLQHYKYVSPETMQLVVNYLKNDFNVIQLGRRNDPLLEGVIDFRNCSLTQAYILLKHSKFFVGGVGGLIHLAKAAKCKSVVLQTTGEPDCLTFYQENLLVKPIDICDLCARNLLDPQHQRCHFSYRCTRNITSESIISTIKNNINYLNSQNATKKAQKESATSDKAIDLEDYFHTKNTLHL